mmetsp:Transcript_1271/g.4715  ORF Transcript_1271/g.4715 Transcript_1271/m.4715 type:complete len:216 (+) Transcript_1271:3986-4633(+)
MANTHLSKPAPALEMVITSSGLNFGSFMYSLTSRICLSEMASLSNSMRERRKLGSAIMPFAPFHDTSLTLRRMHTHSATLATCGCGLAKERISVISSFLRLLRASAAASSAGIASASAASASSFSTAIFAELSTSCSSFLAATSCFASTSAVLVVITSSSSLHSVVFWSTTALASVSVICILSTSSAAWISFCNPPSSRAESSPIRARLLDSEDS